MDAVLEALTKSQEYLNSHHSKDCDGGSICGGCKLQSLLNKAFFEAIDKMSVEEIATFLLEE